MVNEINPVPVAQTSGVSTDTNDLAPLVRQCEVCIVGAGIPGMICALLLKKQGVDVHVYERQGAVYPLPRAVVLADESIHVAVMAGLGHEMKNLIKSSKSASKDFVWVDAAEELLEQLDGRSPGSSGYPSLTLCNQPMIEAAIVLACEAADVPVFRHWEFEGYKKRTSPVDPADREFEVFFKSYKGINRYNPTLNVQAKWLIGADGANSTVRKHAGISQTDFGLCYDWLIVDCKPVEDPTHWPWRQICDPQRPTTMIAGGNRRFRWEFMRLPNETQEELCDPRAVWARMAKYGLNSSNCEVERSVVYRFRSLQADKYWDGDRVCLIGDAAHQMPPFIGQGLNSGIRDAAALAWRLGAILRDGASENIIGSFNLERKAHVDEVMRKAIALGDPICQTDVEKSKAMHAVLRNNFLARNCVPDPFAIELRHAPGGFYDAESHGGYIERRCRKFQPKFDCDEALKEAYAWNLVTLGTGSQTSQDTRQLLDMLQGTVSPVSDEEEDGSDQAQWFAERGNARYCLVRPDRYVFGFATCETSLQALLQHAIGGLGIGGR